MISGCAEKPIVPPIPKVVAPKILYGTVGSSIEELEYANVLCRRSVSKCSSKWYITEKPREVKFSKPFKLDKHEVTNQSFSEFVTKTHYITDAEKKGYVKHWQSSLSDSSLLAKGYSWRNPYGKDSSYKDFLNYPAMSISLRDAKNYCSWRGQRLPTKEEWEFVARTEHGNIFPWGNDWDNTRVQWVPKINNEKVLPIKSFKRGGNANGFYDLAGSVWEWTSSKGPGEKEFILKGGSWVESNPANFRSAVERFEKMDSVYTDYGFRCISDTKKW